MTRAAKPHLHRVAQLADRLLANAVTGLEYDTDNPIGGNA